MAVEGRFGTLSVATRSQRSRRQAMEFSMSRHYRPTEHGLTEATVSGTNSSRVLHRNVSHQQRCAPAKDRAQPGEVRGARVLEVAKGAGLDRRAGRAVATNRAKAVPGDGLDARANRRLPRRGGSPPTPPSLASHRSPRAAPQSGSSPAVGRRRSRRRPGHRAGAVRRKGPVSPKSESGNRTIALDALTVAVLRAHRDAQDVERRLWGEGWVESGRVFTKEDGSTLNPDSVSQRFDRLLAAPRPAPDPAARSAARHRDSCLWPPAPTSRSSLTNSATPRSRSARTSTQVSCRWCRRRPRTPLPRSWRAVGRRLTKRVLKALLAR
jgi:hypothetical protein